MPSYSRRVQIPGKSAEELFEKVASSIDRFIQKSSMGQFEIEKDAHQKEVRLKGSLFQGVIQCREAELSVTGQLSFLAKPFQSQLDTGISKWLAKTFQLSL
jgi:hypothetical protein